MTVYRRFAEPLYDRVRLVRITWSIRLLSELQVGLSPGLKIPSEGIHRSA